MSSSELINVLERSRIAGFLGPGPVVDHVGHAEQFLAALRAGQDQISQAKAPEEATDTFRLVDLGSGGGVPALPLLVAAPDISAVLVDAAQKRCSFLVWAVAELGLTDRVEVWCGRAEEVGHELRARDQFDFATARSFGPPASTVECAAPMLRQDGVLAISEPPGGRTWPRVGLSEISLSKLELPPEHRSIAVFTKVGSIDEQYPRSFKDQQRTPLFVL